MIELNKDDENRFWIKVIVLEENNCWEWISKKDEDGYGRFWLHEKMQGAHRISYTLKYGQISKGLWILHKCNNTSCVNPNHLYAGTIKDNVRDSINSGTLFLLRVKGENRPNAKLKESEIRDIRNMLKNGEPQKDVILKYGLDSSHISAIKNRRIWKSIE